VRQPGADGGWGLRLVERLTTQWGVLRCASGKVVWCEMRADLTPTLSQRQDTVA
jgi:hypothetical protein